MKNRNKIWLAFGIAVVVGIVGSFALGPDTQRVTFANPDQCQPTGVGVYQTAQLMINELVQPECK